MLNIEKQLTTVAVDILRIILSSASRFFCEKGNIKIIFEMLVVSLWEIVLLDELGMITYVNVGFLYILNDMLIYLLVRVKSREFNWSRFTVSNVKIMLSWKLFRKVLKIVY